MARVRIDFVRSFSRSCRRTDSSEGRYCYRMAGLAELARRRKELQELFAFVEDIEYPPHLAAALSRDDPGLGDPTAWIKALRDMIVAIDRSTRGQRPLFVRFIEAEVLHADIWHKRNPLLTLAVSWQSQCSPAKVSAYQPLASATSKAADACS